MDWLQAVIAIVLIDLALSGDNALVIGMAARGLPPGQRSRAIVFGGVLAVVLRVAAAAVVVALLAIPFLQLVASLALLVIAYRLVRKSGGHVGPRDVRPAVSLREAVVTIVVADAVMSLENVLGVGAAAHGSLALLGFGLALSIPIVLFGSAFVVRLLERFPAGIWLGAFALVWTAASLLVDEPALAGATHRVPGGELAIAAGLLLVVVTARALADGRERITTA